jgi:hypothetical protein
MAYILIKNGSLLYPFEIHMLRDHYPNTSFPDDLSRVNLPEFGVFPLTINPQPSYDPMVQSVALGVPVQQNGKWVREWVVEPKPVDVAARNIREKRNDLLSASDFPHKIWRVLGEWYGQRRIRSLYAVADRSADSSALHPSSAALGNRMTP